MARNNNTISRLLIFIILGLIIGGVLGESLGLVFGFLGEWANPGSGTDNVVRKVFIESWPLSIGMNGDPVLIDLYLVKFRFGFGLQFNFVSVLGMIVSLYIMKWTGDR